MSPVHPQTLLSAKNYVSQTTEKLCSSRHTADFQREARRAASGLPTWADVSVGFIKAGQDIVSIIKTDRQYLQSVAVTPQQIVAKLNEILSHISYYEAEASYGNYHIKITKFLGYQLCPFELLYDKPNNYKNYNYWASAHVTLSNISKNAAVTFPNMLIHLIEHCCFFEGGDLRVTPQALLTDKLE